MKIYKFVDTVDGNSTFIMARNQDEAESLMGKLTSLPFKCVGERGPGQQIKPVVLINNILPF